MDKIKQQLVEGNADFNLYKAIQKRSRKDFDFLFRLYYQQLCRFAFGFMKDKQLAEESVQEVFLKLWNTAPKTELSQSIKAYLYISTKNSCLNLLEKNRIRLRYEESYSREQNNTYSLTEQERDPIIESLHKEIENLPEKVKPIYILKNSEGLTYKEISEYMEIPVKTVEKRIGKAIKILREKMQFHKNRILS